MIEPIRQKTFIIDCPWCKAKVAALERGRGKKTGLVPEIGEPYGEIIAIGECPNCQTLLAGESHQVKFEQYNSHKDIWTDFVRIYPKPPKTFSSPRIPNIVKESIAEAERSLQANANIAACVMLGRALEAVCRDVIEKKITPSKTSPTKDGAKPKPIMLGQGIKKIKDLGIIDERLFDWSQQLYAFRNLAAHPEDVSISREDAEDLQTFVHAIIEYIYDLADRYEEFKARLLEKSVKKKKK